MSARSLNEVFRFDEMVMKELNIPVIEKINGNDELWKYVYIDKHKEFNKYRKFMVSTYGRVYKIPEKRIVNPCAGTRVSKGCYQEVSMTYEKGKTIHYYVHRLVALAFIPIDPERPFVNHIDGIPYHNYVWNLEWCTTSENYIHALRTGLKVDKRGEERSNALWTDDEIRLICSMIEEGHKATYIYKALGDILKDPKVEYERVRTLYKHIIHKTHWTHISKDYDIDFTLFNYKKETSSFKDAQKRKEKELEKLSKIPGELKLL